MEEEECFNYLNNTPIQMCIFHQVAIARRYLTKKPKMQARRAVGVNTDVKAHRYRKFY